MNLSTAPLSGLGGEYCGLVSLRYRTEDLTLAERLASIASLAIENARLYRESQQATKIRDHVLSVVAHDLRNPLSTVAMTIGLLLESNATDERVSKQLRMSQRALGRANVLIRDLLDVARMQGGRLSVDTKPESVIGLLRETCEMQSQLARAKAISLTCQVPDDLPDVQLDPNRVRPVLGNLLDNATKFTPSDGRIQLRGESRDGDVVISVSDTGPGIPADEIPKLFEAFCGNRKHILL